MEELVNPDEIQQVPNIKYLVRFLEKKIMANINFDNKVNAMSLTYAKNLGVCIK